MLKTECLTQKDDEQVAPDIPEVNDVVNHVSDKNEDNIDESFYFDEVSILDNN